MIDLPSLTNCTIAVIGLGYVGLPVATQFAKIKKSFFDNSILNRKIIGFDINQKRIDELQKGIDKTNEVNLEEIVSQTNIQFTNDFAYLSKANVFIVTVPTPIDSSKIPDLSLLKKACKTIASAIKNRENIETAPVVIFESTVYPGATEEVCIPIIKKESGLSVFSGASIESTFAYGYSPERINPGDRKHSISAIKKVTSGNNKEVSQWVDKLYSSIIEAGTYNTENVKVAEAAKIIENSQRDLNIALINELSIIFRHLKIDTLDVIEAAQTKWNFLPFKPGLVGGHCIGVDPYYLTYKAEQEGYSPQIILSGRRINDSMGNFYIDQLVLEMAQKGIELRSSKALILGFTFKENCPDIRNTKVLDIVNRLEKYNIKNKVVDPLADKLEVKQTYGLNILSGIPKDTKFSIIVLAVAHKYFHDMNIKKWVSFCSNECIILDLKGIVPRELNPKRP